ncbi:MAG: hypothetical protein R6U32_01945 [Candidatus Woesearchaeota archaeon]
MIKALERFGITEDNFEEKLFEMYSEEFPQWLEVYSRIAKAIPVTRLRGQFAEAPVEGHLSDALAAVKGAESEYFLVSRSLNPDIVGKKEFADMLAQRYDENKDCIFSFVSGREVMMPGGKNRLMDEFIAPRLGDRVNLYVCSEMPEFEAQVIDSSSVSFWYPAHEIEPYRTRFDVESKEVADMIKDFYIRSSVNADSRCLGAIIAPLGKEEYDPVGYLKDEGVDMWPL